MAATENISIVMEVIDKATSVFNGINGSITNVKTSLEQNAAAIKSVGLVSGAAFGVISLAIGKSIGEAREAQVVNAQLEAVLKSTGGAVGLTADQIKNYASELQKTTGIADDVIGTGQNMLLTFTNIGKDVFPEATKTMLDMATAMNWGMTPSAEQLKGTSIQLGKALNDPITGISALSKVGVTFTEQQKEQIAAMVAAWDAAGAQKLILAELGREFGGSALAAAWTFGGRMNILRETLNGVFETIGNQILPIMTTMLEKIAPIIDKVAGWVEENPKLTATILMVWAAVTGIVTVLAALGLAIPPIIAGFAAVNLALGPIWWTIIAIWAAIALLAVAWKTNFLGIQDITAGAWEFIKTTFMAGFNWIMETIQPFLDAVSAFWDQNGAQIVEWLTIFWEWVKLLFWEAFEYIKVYVGTAWDIISGIFSVAFELITWIFKVFFEAITGILTVGMQILSGDWSGAWETIKNTFANIGATIVETGKNVFEKLHTTIMSIVDRIENYVKGALQRIKDTLREIVTLGQAQTQTYNAGTTNGGGTTLPARAFGGNVRAWQPYRVGEDGEEIFVPAGNGRIVSNRDLNSWGQSIYIDMSGMTVTGEADEDRLVDKISTRLGRQYKLADGGVF